MRRSTSTIVLLALFGSCGKDARFAVAPGNPVERADYPGAPFEDRDGNLWFSTVQHGVIRYDGKDFVTFTAADGLGSEAVRDIAEDDDGVLWVATTGGVSRFDGESFTTLTEYRDTPITRGFGPHGNHRDVWDLCWDRQGRLWIATMDGVFRFEGGAFTPFPLPVQGDAERSEFGPKMVYCVYEGPDGALWFGTDGAGVVRSDGDGMTVFTKSEHGLASDRVSAVLRDRRGNLWFGTSDGGVTLFDGSTYSTHLRCETFSEAHGWGRYLEILEDREGNVWFGAAYAGGGVYRHDGAAFRYYSKSEGLGSGGVPSLREDRQGRLWLGTTSGVFRREGERFLPFTRGE